MTTREKTLATLLVGLLGVLGSAGLLFVFVLEPIKSVSGRLMRAKMDYDAKQAELEFEESQIAALLELNPRVAQYNELSLPPRDPSLKKGVKPTEEQKKRHLKNLQVQYGNYLTELLTRNRFARDTIAITARAVEQRAAIGARTPQQQPIYERLAFNVSGRTTMEGLAGALRELYQTPLLHQVRNLSVDLVQSPITPAAPAVAAAPPGAAAPGAAGAPLAAGAGRPGFGAGMFGQGLGGGMFAGRGGFGAPGGFGGRGGRTTARAGGTLEVRMTVEALLVNSAKERASLLPPTTAYPVRVLAEPGRDYALLDKKNIFTGPVIERSPGEERVRTEEKREVLRFVKLTMLWLNPANERWEGTLYDQAKGGTEKRLNAGRALRDFKIEDSFRSTILEGKVVYIDEKQLIFKAEDKFYRLRCGDFLYPAINAPLENKELEELGIAAD